MVVRTLAAMALLLPLAANAGNRGALLQVSANVVRSVQVAVVAPSASGPALRVRTPAGDTWSAPLRDGAAAPGVPVTREAETAGTPGYTLVTVFTDASFGN